MSRKDLQTIPKGTVSKIVTDIESQVSETSHDIDSEEHIIEKAHGNLSHPTLTMEFIQVEDLNTGVLTLRPHPGRPPTQLKNDQDKYIQGRHISAYSLMVEAVLTRITGSEPKNALPLLSKMLCEYIANEDILAKYNSRINLVKKFRSKMIFDVDQRIDVTKALFEAQRFFTDKHLATFFNELPDKTALQRRAKNYYDHSKEALSALSEDNTIIKQIRDSLKRTGELTHYSEMINIAVSYAIKILNKLDDISFKACKTKAAKDEGPTISKAIDALKTTPMLPADKIYTEKAAKEVGSLIAALFDYPLVEAIDLDDDTTDDEKEETASLCRNLLRRHIKLVFDAFLNLRPAFNRPTELKKLLTPLLEKVRIEFEWIKLGKTEFFNSNESLFKSLLMTETGEILLTFTDSSCSLDESRKFSGEKPKLSNPNKQFQEKIASAREDLKPDTTSSRNSMLFKDKKTSTKKTPPPIAKKPLKPK